MKIRRDAVFISSVFMTIALLCLVPYNLERALTWRQLFMPQGPRLFVQNYFMPIGFASLAVIVVGLIVIWKGFIKRVRWTWFVMCTIVCLFVFPVEVLPILQLVNAGSESINWSRWFWDAVKGPGGAREAAAGPLVFLLMLVGLLLPIRSFFRRDQPQRSMPNSSFVQTDTQA